VNREQPDDISAYSKPIGFWITDDSEDCWRTWCISEGFCLDRLAFKHEVDLDESRILILRNAIGIHNFARKYRIIQRWGPANEPEKWVDICIDWAAVAADCAGVIITPYQWGLRLDESFRWYYGWDCASGCIWDVSAIKDIRLVEIDNEVAAKSPLPATTDL